MQQSLKDSADVQAWTRKYPWPSLGVAAAMGFLAAQSLAARPSRAEIRQRAALDDSFDDADDVRAARRAKRRGRSALRKLISPLFEMLVGALQSSIVAAATAHFQQPPQEPSSNGHEPSQGEE